MTSDASWVGSMPDIYQRALGPGLFQPHAVRLAQELAAASPARVLELAAGTGIATAELVRGLPGADITATDLNAAMVALGETLVPQATWLVADAQQLDFPDASFDAVACQFGVMFFPDKPRAFAEAARVLAPAGVLTFLSWDNVSHSPFAHALVESLSAVLPDDPPDFVVEVPYGYADPDRIAADLAAGGLEPVSIERVALRGRAADARTLAEGFCLGSPLRFALADRGSPEELTERLAAQMTARLGEGPLEADNVAWLVSARHPA